MEKFGELSEHKDEIKQLAELRIKQYKGEDWTEEQAKKLKELETLLNEKKELTEEEKKEFTDLIKKQLVGGEQWTNEDQKRVQELYAKK